MNNPHFGEPRRLLIPFGAPMMGYSIRPRKWQPRATFTQKCWLAWCSKRRCSQRGIRGSGKWIHLFVSLELQDGVLCAMVESWSNPPSCIMAHPHIARELAVLLRSHLFNSGGST